jgi:hypothetical protein
LALQVGNTGFGVTGSRSWAPYEEWMGRPPGEVRRRLCVLLTSVAHPHSTYQFGTSATRSQDEAYAVYRYEFDDLAA